MLSFLFFVFYFCEFVTDDFLFTFFSAIGIMAEQKKTIEELKKLGINFEKDDDLLWCIHLDLSGFPVIDNTRLRDTNLLFLKTGIEKVGAKWSFYESSNLFMGECEIYEEEDANKHIRKTLECGNIEQITTTDEGFKAVLKEQYKDRYLVVILDGDGCIIKAYPVNQKQYDNKQY